MARKKKDQNKGEGDGSMNFELTGEHIQAIMALVGNTERLQLDKEALKDDTKGLADAIGCKPGEVSEMVNMVVKERAKGGVVEAREKALDFAKQILESDEMVKHLPQGPEQSEA
jgi:hypothetical protein